MADQIRVFVSHHHSVDESTFTAHLVRDLEGAGADVWVDDTGITSDDFVKKISEGLTGRQWLVLVMTPSALASPWVQREVNAALNELTAGRMRGVLPVVLQPCQEQDIPLLWRPLHRYDATQDYQKALAGVLRALGLTATSTADVTREPATPPTFPARPATVALASGPEKVPQSTKKARQTYGILGALGVTVLIAVVLVAVAENGSGGFRTPPPKATKTPALSTQVTNSPISPCQETGANIHPCLATKFNPIPFDDTTFLQATGWPMSKYCYLFDSYYLVSTSNDSIGAVCYIPVQETRDASIVSNINGYNGFGMVFRARDNTHYYLFDITYSFDNSPPQWAFYKVEGAGAPHTIVRKTSIVLSTTHSTIKVQMTGSHFEFFVDSTRLGTADDTSYGSGKMGLYAGPNTQAQCSFVAVT